MTRRSHELDFFDSLHPSSGDPIDGGMFNDFMYRHSPSFKFPDLRSEASSIPLFEDLIFDLNRNSHDFPTHTERSAATRVTHVDDEMRCNEVPLCTPNLSVFHDESAAFIDQDDAELHDPSPLLSTQNLVSRAPSARPFDSHNQLSFNFAAGFDVIPNDPDFEEIIFSDNEAEDPQQQPIQAQESLDDSANVVLYFKKIITGKKPKLATVTESLFDIRQQGIKSNSSSMSTYPNPSIPDLEPCLDISCCIPAPEPSSSGRSRISKLQHEVLNTWFYSHLDHPCVEPIMSCVRYRYISSHLFKVSIGTRKDSALQSVQTQRQASDELVCKQSQAGLAAHEERTSCS